MNKVILTGRLGKDPETRINENSTVTTISLATSEKWRDREGNPQEKTDWHRVVFWNKPAEIIEQYASKGTLLCIEGKLKTREYDKDGEKRYITEVNATSFEFLGGGKKAENSGQQPQAQQSTQPAPSGPFDEKPDDLPF